MPKKRRKVLAICPRVEPQSLWWLPRFVDRSICPNRGLGQRKLHRKQQKPRNS